MAPPAALSSRKLHFFQEMGRVNSINFFFFFSCNSLRSALPLGMVKLNDVVRVKYGTHKGKTFQVVGFARKDSLGKLITCRLYRSQYRFNFMPWQIEIHPFFAK